MNRKVAFLPLLSIVVALLVTACQSQDLALAAPIEGEKVAAQQELDEVETIERWLECEDCLDGELEAVVKLGPEALPILLRFLEVGPREETLKLVETSLRQSYAELAEYGKVKEDRRLIPRQSQEQFVVFFTENFFSQYQTRAAIAIKQIGDEEAIEKARQLLEAALEVTEREDLRAKLILSLEQLK
ncbi:MAG: hypothetical protein GTO14_10595 [Anaerolineales bacterium]|nr:hypothetical protein [Anaerolineales bacterium]